MSSLCSARLTSNFLRHSPVLTSSSTNTSRGICSSASANSLFTVWKTTSTSIKSSGSPSSSMALRTESHRSWAKQPLFFRIEELKVELAGLDKVDGYTVRLGAGPHASAEKAVYRRGEGGFEGRGRHGQCSCEAPVFLFLGGTDQVVPAEDGPVRICQLGAFTSKALDDMVKPRVLWNNKSATNPRLCFDQ